MNQSENNTIKKWSDDFPNFKQVPMTYIFVGINIIVYIITEICGDTLNAEYMISVGAMNPTMVLHYHQWYRFVSAIFLHFGPIHLLNNIFMLFVFGQVFEKEVTSRRFAVIYISSGILASFCSFVFMLLTYQNNTSAGASGAIFSIIGGIVAIVLLHKGHYQNMTFKKVLIMLVLCIYYGFATENVDNVGHISGLVLGFIFTLILYGIPFLIANHKAKKQQCISD